MASVNTEKPMGKSEQKKIVSQNKIQKTKMEKIQKKVNLKTEESKTEKSKTEINGEMKQEIKKEAPKKIEEKKVEKKVEKKIKKDEVSVQARSLKVSTKVSMGICKFIKYKSIKKAISDLEEVAKLKKPIPMKGEIAHRKGKIMSGKYPQKAAKEFIILLKSLGANATQSDLENPIISEAIPNMASRPFAKGGRARKKSTHIKLVAREKKVKKEESKK